MSSGVAVSNDCLEEFQKLKLGKKAKFIIYKINPQSTEIIVDKISEDPSYDAFLEELPEAEPRYAVYDFEYTKDDGKRNKLCFYAWTPDNAKIKHKMVYASSKDALRRSLVGIASEIQGTDLSEVAYETVLERVTRGTS